MTCLRGVASIKIVTTDFDNGLWSVEKEGNKIKSRGLGTYKLRGWLIHIIKSIFKRYSL